MDHTTLLLDVSLLDTAAELDISALYREFQTLADNRKPRGLRYPLAVLLTIAVLAKLCGASGARAIAEWAKLRADGLADLFDLPRPSMPHPTTWTRVLGHAVTVAALEHRVARLSAGVKSAEVPARGTLQVCLDGKS